MKRKTIKKMSSSLSYFIEITKISIFGLKFILVHVLNIAEKLKINKSKFSNYG